MKKSTRYYVLLGMFGSHDAFERTPRTRGADFVVGAVEAPSHAWALVLGREVCNICLETANMWVTTQ